MKEIKFKADINFTKFKKIFKAQNKSYFKKLGIFCSIFFIPLSIISAYIFITETTMQFFLYFILFLVLAAYAATLIFNPCIIFVTRRNIVKQWFCLHGSKNLNENYKNYITVYEITLSQYGVKEMFSNENLIKLPWFMFKNKYVTIDEGIIFPYDDGKNSSLAYNLLGINYLLREENTGETLFIPKEILNQYPNLTNEISKAIDKSKKTYLKTNKNEDEINELKKWLKQ